MWWRRREESAVEWRSTVTRALGIGAAITPDTAGLASSNSKNIMKLPSQSL